MLECWLSRISKQTNRFCAPRFADVFRQSTLHLTNVISCVRLRASGSFTHSTSLQENAERLSEMSCQKEIA